MPTTPPPPTLTVAARFTGPPTSGNGGYVAGRLAAYLPEAAGVQVTLRQPPLLDTPLQVVREGDSARLTFGGALVAEAVAVHRDLEAVEPVPFAVAEEAAAHYRGWARHPFPGCFVCGPQRPAPDGLGIRPGPVAGRAGQTAAAWRPAAELGSDREEGSGAPVPPELVWSALDCPGGWTVDLAGRPAVLGQMTAAVDALPEPGDECVVVGRLLGAEGRKSYTATTLYDGDGRVLARAHAVWITVDSTAGPRADS